MRFALIENATGKVVNTVEIADGDGSTIDPGFSLVATNFAQPSDDWDKNAKTFARKDDKGATKLLAETAIDTKGIAAKVKAFTDQKAAALAQAAVLEVG